MPKFSVIIPVYNVEEYVEECLYSVINQTNQDLEIIVVNDGSTDNSLQVVEKIKKENPSVKIDILNKKNGGLSSARNYGYNQANGQYIYFLDSDDYISCDCLEKIETVFSKDLEIDVCTFDAESFVEENFDFRINDPYYYMRSSKGINQGKYIGREFFDLQIENSAWNSVVYLYAYRKTFIDKYNLSFDEKIIHEDEIYTFNVCQKANKIEYISESLYKRRYRPNSIMTNLKKEKSINSKIKIIKEISENYDQTSSIRTYITNLLKHIFYHDFKKGMTIAKYVEKDLYFYLWLSTRYPLSQIKKKLLINKKAKK